MTLPPTRASGRIPGFSHKPGAASQTQSPRDPYSGSFSRRAGTRQLNLRVAVLLHERYRCLLRSCEDAGLDTSLTEILHALLYEGPETVEGVRELLSRWRRYR